MELPMKGSPTSNGPPVEEQVVVVGEEPEDDLNSHDLQYSIDETPPFYLCVLLGLQHYLTMFGATLSIPLLVAPAMCVGNDIIATAEMLGTILFVSGFITIIQATFGSRLPIIQGGTFAYLVPTFAILNLPTFKCPVSGPLPFTNETDLSANETDSADVTAFRTEVWQIRMREIQGAIIASSVFQVAIGLSGVIGFVLKFIGPLSIAPTITLVGLSLFRAAAYNAGQNWWIAALTIFLIALFSLYLRNVSIPCCAIKNKRCGCGPYKLFQLFPVLLAILISWAVCHIITVTDVIKKEDTGHWGYNARTDVKMNVLAKAQWFRFPYPGQWGMPTFSVASVFGMLAGVLAGMVESIGDYYAAARMSGAPPPPLHAINRGIFVEGLGSFLAGWWGTGNGTTSYSENIGAIGITKVGSRRVIQTAAVIIMLFGVIGKFGALFVAIPNPVIGGVFFAMFGLIAAAGVSNMQFVDLNSMRNLFIFGFSLLLGIALPDWIQTHGEFMHSGNDVVDQLFTVLLTTAMFVGGLTAFILDNTIPGSRQERGLIAWEKQGGAKCDNAETYDIPGTKFLKRWKWLNYLPISPTFTAGTKV